jgi:hypothetical protein
MLGRIENPRSLLWELEADRESLIVLGVPEDARGVFFSSESDQRFYNYSGIWLIGNSIVTRSLTTGEGSSKDGWHSQLVDIDTQTGDFYRHGQSNLGTGFGRHNVFDEDYHPGTTGVAIKQTHNLLRELAYQMMTNPAGIEVEPYRPTEQQMIGF